LKEAAKDTEYPQRELNSFQPPGDSVLNYHAWNVLFVDRKWPKGISTNQLRARDVEKRVPLLHLKKAPDFDTEHGMS
jgi:hypothetical protein